MLPVLLISIGALLAFNCALAGAVAVLRVRNERRKRRWDRMEAIWEPRLLDLLAGEATPSQLAPLVAPGDLRYVIEIVARTIRVLSGEDRNVIQSFGKLLLPGWLGNLNDRRPATRARTVQITSLIDLSGNATEIVKALDDPSPLVAMVAARALARERRDVYLVEVLARLERFRLWSPSFLATMFAAVGPSVAPLLRGYLADTRQTHEVRVVAAESLRRLQDAAAARTAAAILASETVGPDLAASCLRLIEQIGHSVHRSVVVPLVQSPHYMVRARAVAALASVGGRDDMPVLEAALCDPSPWVAIQSARTLAQLGNLEPLVGVASKDSALGAVAREVLMEAA